MGNRSLLERDAPASPKPGIFVAGGTAASVGKKQKRATEPRVSIIIPAHNEEDYLNKTLHALERLQYPNYEVIVVANGCTDRTAELAREHCDRLIVLSQKCLGIARNLGARVATGDLLLFLDADTLLEPGALRVLQRSFSHRDAAGTLKGRPDCERWIYRAMYFLKNLCHRSRFHCGSAGVIVCWKQDFMHLGGFDERLQVRENSELIRRLMRFGEFKYVGSATATTSMRRYERRGVGRTVWLWTRLWFRSLVSDLHDRQYETVR